VIVSHDVAETLSIADYVYVIANGKIIGQGTPSSINNDKSAQVRQFVDGLPDGPVPFHYPARPLGVDLMETAP
jgi:phospholipid/cholesterol/gamma-HCH transport system ATP-binding protein